MSSEYWLNLIQFNSVLYVCWRNSHKASYTDSTGTGRYRNASSKGKHI